MKVALTIAGSDSIGGAGIQADLKSFASLGVHGCSAITCITAQNTTRITRVEAVSPELVKEQIIAVLEDVEVGAAKTGAVYTAENVKVIAEILSKRGIPLVIDPVLVSTTGASLAKDDYAASLKRYLVPGCALITPNASEAEKLTGIAVRDMESAAKASEMLLSLGASGVLIKGISDAGNITDYLTVAQGATQPLTSTRLPGEFHGTGCILSALITGYLTLGYDICTATVKARGRVFSAIDRSSGIGKGIRMLDPLGDIIREAGKAPVLEELISVKDSIERDLAYELIPEVGSNLCYSLPSPWNDQEVAGFTGRIVRDGKRPRIVGCPRFGASRHVARILLAASRHDASVRSAMNVKYNERNLESCRKAGLALSSFSRDNEPEGVSTMDWGTNEAIKAFGSVPDAIWDEGGHGKEPMIRILGKNPSDVMHKVALVADMLRK